jgi:hypothetical protein
LYNVAAGTPSSAAIYLARLAFAGQLIGTVQLAHDALRGMSLPTSHVFHRPFQPDIEPQDSKTGV